MQRAIVWFIMTTLLLLPFSGNGSVVMDHDNMSAAQVVMPKNASDQDHCEQMAARLAEVRAHYAAAANDLAAPEDCCDEALDCASFCGTDCGHCAMSGHGCSAALTAFSWLQAPHFASAMNATPSFYTLLNGQPTPPPIIA
ncbi:MULTISPECIES: hypothetical protein [Alishewanella]|uniref:hypothetical protein n=1 Tax=Alishewanella TaxID=111142 RepID=UPI000B128C71|nr:MULTISPECIES: hypothetical protein [Alishewanella]